MIFVYIEETPVSKKKNKQVLYTPVVSTTPGNHLFVYGIFLDQRNRDRYGMYNAMYTTVPGYKTVGDYIVQAVPDYDDPDTELTGLIVQVDPSYWERLDSLEQNYNRITVRTSTNELAYMYAA
jgi:gamma-glutamylcyclotransferase (GGCT)/AIG2-like uncharacterized protein YtfP